MTFGGYLPTKQIFDKLIEARGKGHTIEQCAHYAGVSRRTVQRYIERGRNGEPAFRAWYRRFSKAKTNHCTILLDRLQKEALNGHIPAIIFMLERIHGFTKDGPPPVQIHIDADQVDIKQAIGEYNQHFRALIEGPAIDLDEE